MVKHDGFAKCALFRAEGCGTFSGSLPGTADSAGAFVYPRSNLW